MYRKSLGVGKNKTEEASDKGTEMKGKKIET